MRLSHLLFIPPFDTSGLPRLILEAIMFARATTVASLASFSLAATYSQVASHVGETFLDGFNVMAIPDPTNGRVYVLVCILQLDLLKLIEFQ